MSKENVHFSEAIAYLTDNCKLEIGNLGKLIMDDETLTKTKGFIEVRDLFKVDTKTLIESLRLSIINKLNYNR